MIIGVLGRVLVFFLGNLVVLLNECLSQGYSIKKGLKQQNPLPLFLFLLMVEGLIRFLGEL